MTRKTALERHQEFKEQTEELERQKKWAKNSLPEGVFVGVVRVGRQYQVLELYTELDGTRVSKEHEPGAFGFAIALAEDRLNALAWKLNNQPWSEEQINWRKDPKLL